MKLVIVGSGYVGLVSGVCLATKGHEVICVDINPNIAERLNRGEPHIYELGLKELLKGVIAEKRFSATTNLYEALRTAELAMIAVGTPCENGVIDLRYVREVARSIGQYIKSSSRFMSVVVKSTVIPSTTDTIVRQEIESASGMQFPYFGLGMNPEFLREGNAIEDFMGPDRIVLGHEDLNTLRLLDELYAPWLCEKVRVNTRTAEFIKYMNNALLATQISAVNEIANLAAQLGNIDMADVVHGVILDKRWSPIIEGKRIFPHILTYLVPGCGFGGSCFPKDVQALCSQGKGLGLKMQLLNSVLDINEEQPNEVVRILANRLGALTGRHIMVLGLAFKPGTDDVRESASLKIVKSLLQREAKVTVHDPIANENFKKAMGEVGPVINYLDNWKSYIEQVEVVIVASKWDEYAALSEMDLSGKIIFDARRMFKPSKLLKSTYLTIGDQRLSV